MSVRVLCIDDDRRLQELLVSWLGQNGVQEKLTRQWIDRCLKRLGARAEAIAAE